MKERETELKAVRDRLKATSTAEILGKIEKLVSSERDLRKQLEQLQAKSAGGEADEILSQSQDLGPIRFVSAICAADSTGMKRLRDLADRIKSKAPDALIVLGVADPDGSKASVLVTLGSKVAGGLDANELIQVIAPCILGRGGGKKDLAQAGGTNSEGLPQVLIEARKWISAKLKLG
jgi:alanyl-tRNA synthetase